jgi:hypothetical protein
LSSQAKWAWGFLFLVQKESNSKKKKVFTGRTLKNCLPNLPLEPGKAKKENQLKKNTTSVVIL